MEVAEISAMHNSTIRAIVIGLAAAALGWLAMGSGLSLYQDWAFLHAARLYTEAQQAQQRQVPPAPQATTPPPAK
jgi:type II secretory pathway pseudopilin PulG